MGHRFSVAPFSVDDVDKLVPEHRHSPEFSALSDWRAVIRMAGQNGPAWTGRYQGRVIGCAGFAMLWRGRAGTWWIFGEGIPSAAWLAIHRTMHRHIIEMRRLNVWRIEAEIMDEYAAGMRSLDLLGFKSDGVAEGYGPNGETFLRYARVDMSMLKLARLHGSL